MGTGVDQGFALENGDLHFPGQTCRESESSKTIFA
jgi:hypothetical protein